jgi:protein-tyrosine phosphatase
MKKKILVEEEDEEDDWAPDLHWLTENLAVGGCFPRERSSKLASDHGVNAVIDLRLEECDDEALLGRHGIDFLHLPTPDLEPASPQMLDEGVRFARDHIARGDRVLIHCQHGIGRSALLALCVLVDAGWAPLEALRQAKDKRAAVSPSEQQYRGWVLWLESRGVHAPDYHTFGCIAYRHLAQP